MEIVVHSKNFLVQWKFWKKLYLFNRKELLTIPNLGVRLDCRSWIKKSDSLCFQKPDCQQLCIAGPKVKSLSLWGPHTEWLHVVLSKLKFGLSYWKHLYPISNDKLVGTSNHSNFVTGKFKVSVEPQNRNQF